MPLGWIIWEHFLLHYIFGNLQSITCSDFSKLLRLYKLQSITFHNFVIQAGTDASLVPTGLSTLNSTVKLSYRNTGTFFGVHVSSTPLVLSYSQLVLAAGNVNIWLNYCFFLLYLFVFCFWMRLWYYGPISPFSKFK